MRKQLMIVLLATSGVACAGENTCTAASINGGYAFRMTGTNTAQNVSFAIVGRFMSDGQGKFTGFATQSVQGKPQKVTFEGKYTVSSDCSGSSKLVFQNGVNSNLDFVIADDGARVEFIDSDAGTLETGTAIRQFKSGAGS